MTMTTTFTVTHTSTSRPSQLIRDMLAACRQSRDSWAEQHYRAWLQSDLTCKPIERREVCLRKMIVGWAALGESHAEMYLAPIGQDAVTGDHFAAIGKSLRDLINTSDIGRYDGGTLDRLIVTIGHACGVDLDEGE